jgi:hypothetical protein
MTRQYTKQKTELNIVKLKITTLPNFPLGIFFDSCKPKRKPQTELCAEIIKFILTTLLNNLLSKTTTQKTKSCSFKQTEVQGTRNAQLLLELVGSSCQTSHLHTPHMRSTYAGNGVVKDVTRYDSCKSAAVFVKLRE